MMLVLACVQKAALYHYRNKNDAFVRLNAGCTRVCSLFNRNRELPSRIRDRGDPFSRGLRCLANQQSGDLQSILISRVIPLHRLRDKVLQLKNDYTQSVSLWKIFDLFRCKRFKDLKIKDFDFGFFFLMTILKDKKEFQKKRENF